MREWSGVMARDAAPFGANVLEIFCGGGVDHEKVADGEGTRPDEVLCAADREADGSAVAQGSRESLWVFCRPRTRLSKSPSSPIVLSRPFVRFALMLDIKSARFAEVELIDPISCSFRVCSCSIRSDKDLIKVIKA